jgi:hypothetical protein
MNTFQLITALITDLDKRVANREHRCEFRATMEFTVYCLHKLLVFF